MVVICIALHQVLVLRDGRAQPQVMCMIQGFALVRHFPIARFVLMTVALNIIAVLEMMGVEALIIAVVLPLVTFFVLAENAITL